MTVDDVQECKRMSLGGCSNLAMMLVNDDDVDGYCSPSTEESTFTIGERGQVGGDARRINIEPSDPNQNQQNCLSVCTTLASRLVLNNLLPSRLASEYVIKLLHGRFFCFRFVDFVLLLIMKLYNIGNVSSFFIINHNHRHPLSMSCNIILLNRIFSVL